MTRKTQTVGTIAKFTPFFVATQQNFRISRLHTDGESSPGSTYVNLADHYGIIGQTSAPRTPEQNGAAERAGGDIDNSIYLESTGSITTLVMEDTSFKSGKTALFQ
jgi:hypothetical protein